MRLAVPYFVHSQLAIVQRMQCALPIKGVLRVIPYQINANIYILTPLDLDETWSLHSILG